MSFFVYFDRCDRNKLHFSTTGAQLFTETNIKKPKPTMAFTQAANVVERMIGHGDNATVTTDVSNYNDHGMETGERILATTWQGKNNVKLGMSPGYLPGKAN